MALSTEQAPTGQLKRPHFHWVWKPAGQPNASWKWQLFGYYWRETPRRLNLVFSFRGLLLWTASLSFAAYLIGAAVIVGIWSRNPYNQVGYLDVVLPTRWAELRALRGKGMIDEGIAEIKAKRYATGMMLLVRGVTYRPQDFNGRLQLAKIFASIGQLHRAKQLAMDGFEHGTPPKAYCDFVFAVTTYLQDYDTLLDASRELQQSGSNQLRRESLRWQAVALEKLGQIQELNALRENSKGEGFSVHVEQAWARAQLVSGNPATALREVLRAPEQFGLPGERFLLQLELGIAARDYAQVEATIADWLAKDPFGPIPKAREIVALIQLGNHDRATDLIRSFFLHYASDLPSVVYLFRALVELENPTWLKAAYTEAASSGKIPISASILYVQGLLVCGDVQGAQGEFAKIESFMKSSKNADDQWAVGTRRLIDVLNGPSESNRSLLMDYFATKQATPEAFRFAWRALARVQSPMAGDLAQLARNRYPALRLGDPGTMAEWANRGRSTKLAPKTTQALTSSMRPASSTANAQRSVASEFQVKEELRRIDDLLTRRSFGEAEEAIRQLERTTDESSRALITWRRIELHGQRRELAELTASLRLYLQGKSPSLTDLRKLAEQWRTPKQRDAALVLLREIRNRFPEALWASTLQRDMERELLVSPAENLTENRD